MNGIHAPIRKRIGHHCIFAALLASIAGPTRGIQAIPVGPTFAFLAIAISYETYGFLTSHLPFGDFVDPPLEYSIICFGLF